MIVFTFDDGYLYIILPDLLLLSFRYKVTGFWQLSIKSP